MVKFGQQRYTTRAIFEAWPSGKPKPHRRYHPYKANEYYGGIFRWGYNSKSRQKARNQALQCTSTTKYQPAVLSSTKVVSKSSNQQLACSPTHVSDTILPTHVNGADPKRTHEAAVNLEAHIDLFADGDGPSYPPGFGPLTNNHIICNAASNHLTTCWARPKNYKSSHPYYKHWPKWVFTHKILTI